MHVAVRLWFKQAVVSCARRTAGLRWFASFSRMIPFRGPGTTDNRRAKCPTSTLMSGIPVGRSSLPFRTVNTSR